MSDDTDQARLYGAPDTDDHGRPAQGLRGEQAAGGAGTTHDLTHSESIDGREVAVEESSGVAFAEASGAVARNQARLAEEDAGDEEDRPAG